MNFKKKFRNRIHFLVLAIVIIPFQNCTKSMKTSDQPTKSESFSSGATTPVPGPNPSPSPNPSPGIFPKVGDYPIIPSNFDTNSELVASWGTGAIPASAAPDVVGAFRFLCNPSHEAYDDPIVFPGQPGASHLHQFFGNTLANAHSTYDSLRTTGMSTCNSILNRSAYWIPAMMNGKGQVVRPDYVTTYYKRYPNNSALCTQLGKGCVDIPRGLRMVFGQNMDGTAPALGTSGYFNCDAYDWSRPAPGTVAGHYKSIIAASKNCPVGGGSYSANRLGFVISAPECWDGINLDSADHRSHLAYSKYNSNGQLKCPSTHPWVLPTFTLGVWYTTDSNLYNATKPDGTWDGTHNGWHFSSDEMFNLEPGITKHADWFGAWDDNAMQTWIDNCINKLLNCSGGDLGNGQQLKMFSGFSMVATPRIVNPPQ